MRLNELTRDKKFHGVFNYRGVPLKELLELAVVQKGEAAFSKPLDMALVIRNREGKADGVILGGGLLPQPRGHRRGFPGGAHHAPQRLCRLPYAGGLPGLARSLEKKSRLTQAGGGQRFLYRTVPGKPDQYRSG